MKNKEKNFERKSRLKALFKPKNVFIAAIGLLFLVQYFQIQGLLGTFSFLQGRDSSFVTEIGQVKDAYTNFGGDLNEIRDFLRMPTKNYFGFDEPANNTDDSQDANQNEVGVALFQYVDYLSAEQNIENLLNQNKPLIDGLLNDSEIAGFFAEDGLQASAVNEDDDGYSAMISDTEGRNLFYIYLSKDDGSLNVHTVAGEQAINSDTMEQFRTELKSYIEENFASLKELYDNLENIKAGISAAIEAPETQAAIAELGISLKTDFAKENSKIVYTVYNNSGSSIGQIVLDPTTLEISLVDLNNPSFTVTTTDILSGLVPFLQKLDTKTLIEKKVDESLTDLSTTLQDAGFQLLLSQNGLSISQEPREDDERIYYDILDPGGTVISTLVVEKTTGVINIVQPDGTNSENLLKFDPDFKKKTLEIPDEIPDYGNTTFDEGNTFNILIAGKHGSLVDTMIFAHVDEDKGEVRMISIPRDLFYNGRKINAFAFYYGMPELKKVLSDITGYELDRYILIDMYAFIDVIDLIGGIDIHLDSAVIDPTYKTIDDGVVGTLHYEPGDYHLGGKEALRLARTRHTSSDFARAERQQMILKALQDKAKNFGFGDADTIYEIAKTVLSKTETDVSLDDAIVYYFRYQNYEIVSNNVMSSGNVLYVPPYITTENCQNLITQAQAAGQPVPGCMNENHAYTLLPRNDNWNIVKWYFRENFEGV
ncbi:MAG: LCP family protein [Candidatus Peregrinibacteria bacterium]